MADLNRPLAATSATGDLLQIATWQWWSGLSDEWFQNGPFDTRDQALAELDGYAGFIIEASPADPVSLSAQQLIEAQYFEDNEAFDYDHGEPDRAGDADDIAAAGAELQRALDAWCARWDHTFVRGNLFAATRNKEYVEAASVDPIEVEP